MNDENVNTLLRLEREAIALGWPFRDMDFCYEVAKEAEELGEENPSQKALDIARKKIEKLRAERSSRCLLCEAGIPTRSVETFEGV